VHTKIPGVCIIKFSKLFVLSCGSELQATNTDLQRDLANLKKELELTNQKLGSSMHSIKTFWSPELKKERALRKEESAKYALMNDQLKLLNSENQVEKSLPPIGWKRDYLASDWLAWKRLLNSENQVKKLASYWLEKRLSGF
jgi:hypothetical protein